MSAKELPLIEFLKTMEKEVEDVQYGTITVNVVLANGIPNMQSLNITKLKRKKYGKST